MDLRKINARVFQLDVDYLYHFGIDTSMDLAHLFGDVRYVVLSRLNSDIAIFVQEFAKHWYNIKEEKFSFKPLFKTERYHLYKIGPVIAVSHGVGAQSMLICLNEITKLLAHLQLVDVNFFKIGPAGGLGLPPGEIVLGDAMLNHRFQPIMQGIACGETYEYATYIRPVLTQELQTFFATHDRHVHVGGIMTASDYYEGQCRFNGFLPVPYSQQERQDYWQKALTFNVKSIDMESLYLAGFCHELDIAVSMMNHIVVDRLKSDDIVMTQAEQEASQRNASQALSHYLVETYHEN